MKDEFILPPSYFILVTRQWLYCGFRGPYSCGAAGEFSERMKDEVGRMNFFIPLPFAFRLLESPLSLTSVCSR